MSCLRLKKLQFRPAQSSKETVTDHLHLPKNLKNDISHLRKASKSDW